MATLRESGLIPGSGRTPATSAFFDPKPFGPQYELADPTTLVIRDGKLAGQAFRLETEVARREAHIRLHQESLVGRCDFELKTKQATILLWDCVVSSDWRNQGIAALMARIGLRRLLSHSKSASIGIRMIKLLDPGHKILQIKNIGMGVIAHQLGMSFDCDLPSVLRATNIERVDLIHSDGDSPPAYRILLRSYPMMLVAVMTALDTGRPLPQRSPAYSQTVSPEVVERWATDASVIFGNGDYLLRHSGVMSFVSRIADTPEEAGHFLPRIKPIS